MKKLKNFYEKVLVIWSITKDVFSNWLHVVKVIASKDIEKLKVQAQQAEIEQQKNIEQEMDELVQEQNQALEETPDHKKVGRDMGLPPRIMTQEEMDPKSFVTRVPEEHIYQSHIVTGGINNFTRLLYTAQIFREAGMTPMFLTNKQESIVRVAAEETWMKPLN